MIAPNNDYLFQPHTVIDHPDAKVTFYGAKLESVHGMMTSELDAAIKASIGPGITPAPRKHPAITKREARRLMASFGADVGDRSLYPAIICLVGIIILTAAAWVLWHRGGGQ